MPTFTYVARDQTSKLVRGELAAENKNIARLRLKELGYFVTSIEEQKVKGKRAFQFPTVIFERIKLDDLVIFSRQFATLVRSGLSLVQILTTLRNQTQNTKLQKVIDSIIFDVEAGETLADSFAKHPRVFSNLFISLVRAGETGGVLDEILEEIANYYDKEQDLRLKIRSAFAYPTVVTILTIGIVIFLLIYVVPVFERVYEQLRAPLPLPTVMLIKASNIIRKVWWLVIGTILGIIVLYRYFKESKFGRPIVDKIKLQMPIFANLNLKTSLARFTRTFGLLTRAGVPILRCLEVIGELDINYVLTEATENIGGSIREGESLTEQLQKYPIFPPMLIQLVAVGEETGNLEESLFNVANFYDREVDHIVKRLTTILEPVMTLILGIILGFIALSLYLPMFDLVKAIR